MKNKLHGSTWLLGVALAMGSNVLLAQEFEFADDGRLTAPIYRYGDTGGNGEFWDGQELSNNALQFQYTGNGQAGTFVFGVDGTFTTPAISVLGGSTLANLIFGDTGGNGQFWNAAELADNNLQVQYSGNGQAGTYFFGVDGTLTTPILELADGPAGNGQVWTQQEIAANQLQVLYSAQPNPDVAPEFIFSPQGFFETPVLQLGDLAGNGEVWTQQELLAAVTDVDNVPGGNTLQVQYSGAGQAGTFNFGVTGVFEAPILQLADIAGNDQVWTQQELGTAVATANGNGPTNNANNARLQYSGAGQAGTYFFGVDGRFTTPILQLADGPAGNDQLWTLEEIDANVLEVLYSGTPGTNTPSFTFSPFGIFETPILQLADTGGNTQVWTIEELADNNLEIFYSGNPGPAVPSYVFGVNGTLTVPTLVETSDVFYKENIAPINGALEMVRALKGVSFNWKDSGRESIGFVAQDIEEILPQLVHTDTDGHKAVEYSKIVAVLVEAFKEQQQLIDQQATELQVMRQEVSEVRELSARLELLEDYLIPSSGTQTVQVSQ